MRLEERPNRVRAKDAVAVVMVLVLALGAFPMASGVDTEKPYVVEFTPADGATEVGIDTAITITFSEDIRSDNLDSQITLRDSKGTVVNKQVDYSSLTYKAILTPEAPLKYSMLYTVVVSTFILDIAGNTLKEVERWTFNTTREKVPPQVVSTTPKDNAKDVSINATMEVVFSEEMDRESLKTCVVVHDALDNPVIGNTTVSQDGLSVTFDPLFTFGFGESYTVTVLKTAKDLAGNLMTADHEFGFKVQLERIPPRVVNLEPVDQKRGVKVTAKVYVTYSEPMNSTSLAGSVVISDPDGEELSTTPQYNADNYTLTIRPDRSMDYQTLYSVLVKTLAQDLAGNALDHEYSITFTTEPLPQRQPIIEQRLPPEDRFNWYEGIAATFEVKASDPNDDILVYTWYVNDEEQEGMTFNEFNFYPEPGSEGSYKITVEIRDGVTAPVRHFWIIDVVATSNGGGGGEDEAPFSWTYMTIIIVLVVLAIVLSAIYLQLMDRKKEILARTMRRLRPLAFKREGPKAPPSYEEMYLRADGVYAKKSPEFKPIAPPKGAKVEGKAAREATVFTSPVMGDAPKLVDAKEVQIERATVGPYTKAAPELAKKRPTGVRVCPKCGQKVIEAAHGRLWCDTCGFIS